MATRITLLVALAFLVTAARSDQTQPDNLPPTIILVAALILTAALLRRAHPRRKKHLS